MSGTESPLPLSPMPFSPSTTSVRSRYKGKKHIDWSGTGLKMKLRRALVFICLLIRREMLAFHRNLVDFMTESNLSRKFYPYEAFFFDRKQK